jgi:uncharacterized alkaline shock family protein YloU
MMSELTEDLGEIIIAPEVLETIVGVTVSKIDGVYALRNKRTIEALGKKSEGRGVYIKSEADNQIAVDLYLFLTAGCKVPDVARSIQTEVQERVLGLTEIEVTEVNLHILGMVAKSQKKPDFDDLFKEGFFDAE